MAEYVRVLREETGFKVQVYEEHFFRADDLEYVDERDRELVKAHLFAGISARPTTELFRASSGIGAFIEDADVQRFVDAFVTIAMYNEDKSLAASARRGFISENVRTPSSVDPEIRDRLDAWRRLFVEQGNATKASAVQKMIEAYTFPDFDEPEEDASDTT